MRASKGTDLNLPLLGRGEQRGRKRALPENRPPLRSGDFRPALEGRAQVASHLEASHHGQRYDASPVNLTVPAMPLSLWPSTGQ